MESVTGQLRVEEVATGLHLPWSLVFLPDGQMLVSEKHPARLRRISRKGEISGPLDGLPAVYGEGNGGLLGLALHPQFEKNQLLYFAFSEPGDARKASLAVARARLCQDRITDVSVIFRQTPKVEDIRNFGGRLVFAPDGNLFVLTGDRFAQDLVQDRSNTIGTVVRITPEGEVPPDNPFVGQQGIDPTIWSWGHRNMGGGAIHPETGKLWAIEFGPWGGDELNIPEAGKNYGWPLVSWGRHYSGEPIPDPPSRPDLASSIFYWAPVISPSGMIFHNGSGIPAWKRNLLMGGLSSNQLTRLTLRNDQVIGQESINFGVRIRDVIQGPDGAIYLLTDQQEGKVLRLVLQETGNK